MKVEIYVDTSFKWVDLFKNIFTDCVDTHCLCVDLSLTNLQAVSTHAAYMSTCFWYFFWMCWHILHVCRPVYEISSDCVDTSCMCVDLFMKIPLTVSAHPACVSTCLYIFDSWVFKYKPVKHNFLATYNISLELSWVIIYHHQNQRSNSPRCEEASVRVSGASVEPRSCRRR